MNETFEVNDGSDEEGGCCHNRTPEPLADWLVHSCIREGLGCSGAVIVFEGQDIPDALLRFNPFAEDVRRAALVKKADWDCWEGDDSRPDWINHLGVYDDVTGIGNISWHVINPKWVLVFGSK